MKLIEICAGSNTGNALKTESSEDMVYLKLTDYKGTRIYWNGVNWTGTKASAVPVKREEATPLQRQFRVRATIIPVNPIKEAADEELSADLNTPEVQEVQDYWDSVSDSIKEYGSIDRFEVKKNQDTGKYEVYSADGDTRTLEDTFTSKFDLNTAYRPIRPNQKPDVEGYTIYTSAETVEAVKAIEPVKLKIDGLKKKLPKGDYLVLSKDEFKIVKADVFDSTMEEN